ncbi:MAG: tetratricopeptide repeat protein [Tepidisphaeraceae bacterium]
MPVATIQNAIRLHESGDLAAAESAYRLLLKSQPDHPMAQHYLGMILHQRGRSEEALKLVRKSLAGASDVPDFHCNLAIILRDTGRLEDAVAALCRAIRMKPRYPQALNNLGDALRMLGKTAEARSVLEQSIEITPAPEAINNLALVCVDEKNFAEAAELSRQVLRQHPANSTAQKTLARALRGGGDLPGSIAAWQSAVKQNPKDPEAHVGLADAQRAAGDLQNAIKAYEQASALKPNWPECLTNYSAALFDTAQVDRAIEVGRKAVRLAPKNHEARFNLSLALLCAGEFREGWEFYESRWHCEGFEGTLAPLPQPAWDGSDLNGKTILLRSEQGCGDAIQFARYIPLLAQRGATVVLQCQTELTDLLAGVPGLSRIVSREEDPGPFDVHLPLLSTARRFHTTPQTIPQQIPYLQPDPARVDLWTDRISGLHGLKCGLVWAGNPLHHHDKNRSLPPQILAPLAAAPGVSFVSLQKNSTTLPPLPGILNIAPDLHNFADTAAALSQLDLLITADTSIAHLAGAMALPVWTLIPHAPDWRWMLAQDRTAWYPTMRLFRQSTPGDWPTVLQRVVSELKSTGSRVAA